MSGGRAPFVAISATSGGRAPFQARVSRPHEPFLLRAPLVYVYVPWAVLLSGQYLGSHDLSAELQLVSHRAIRIVFVRLPASRVLLPYE